MRMVIIENPVTNVSSGNSLLGEKYEESLLIGVK